MKTRNWKALLLTLALTLTLVLPAQAAGVRLTWEKSSDGYSLTLRGLGEESVYGVQIELALAGKYASAAFAPNDSGAYSECRLSASEDSTRVVVYLTSQKPLNSGTLLEAGTLTLDKGFSMPSSASLTLLGHELKTLNGSEGVVVAVSEQTRPASGRDDDDDDDEPDRYRVRVSSARWGAVKSDTDLAQPRETVTLTVTPEDRYGLDTLRVTAPGGREMSLTDVGSGRYTFRMPAAEVEVTATFHWTGLTHIPMHFSDVTELDWYHSAAHYVYENGMMTGTTDTTFSPDMDTSRGMIVTILHRLEGNPEAEQSHFPDVSRQEYYAPAVDWAYANGIVSGYGGNESGTFGPGNPITREQLASILYRYAEKKGMDVTIRGDLNGFADRDAISDYAGDAVAWAVGVGLISGMGDGSINPGGTASRAQVATILARYCQNIME